MARAEFSHRFKDSRNTGCTVRMLAGVGLGEKNLPEKLKRVCFADSWYAYPTTIITAIMFTSNVLSLYLQVCLRQHCRIPVVTAGFEVHRAHQNRPRRIPHRDPTVDHRQGRSGPACCVQVDVGQPNDRHDEGGCVRYWVVRSPPEVLLNYPRYRPHVAPCIPLQVVRDNATAGEKKI